MEFKDYIILTLAVLMLVGIAAGYMATDEPANSDVNETNTTATTTPTPQPANESEIPQAVEDSEAGAAMLKSELRKTERFSDARVFITKRGEVVVVYTSQAEYGAELKSEMTEVAYVYSDVMGEHPETGGLTVAANGVELLVSSDTAIAHNEGRLKDSAYEETFLFKTTQEEESK